MGGVLGNVLGSHDRVVEDGVTQASGLDSPRAKQLMMILVPLVLAGIARHKSSQGRQTTQVGPDLRSDAQSAQAYAERKAPHTGGLLGSIMNQVMQKPRSALLAEYVSEEEATTQKGGRFLVSNSFRHAYGRFPVRRNSASSFGRSLD